LSGQDAALATSRKRISIWVLLGALALLTTYWTYETFLVALDSSKDFEWGPARALLFGSDPYRLYLNCLPCDNPPFTSSIAPSYPASGLILLWPLAALPWPAAKVVWAALNLFFGFALSLLLWRCLLPGKRWGELAIATILLFGGTPFLNNLSNGQHAVFTLACFSAALWAEKRGMTALASAFLAASWFKYTVTVPLSLIFVARGRWKPLVGAAGIHAVLTLFAALWTGTSPLDLLLGPLRVAHVGTTAGDLNPIALAHALGIDSSPVPIVATALLVIVVIGAAFRSRPDDDLPLLSLLALFAYAVVYHLGYDIVLLVFPLFYVIERFSSWRRRDSLERAWALMLSLLLAWTWFADHPIQMLKIQRVDWVLGAYPAYHLALAVYFYLTLAVGVILVGRRHGGSPFRPMDGPRKLA
jgi:hypothetical protein